MKILHLTNVDAAGGTNTNCLQFVRSSPAANTLVVFHEPGQMQSRWLRAGLEVRYLRILQGPRSAFVRGLRRVTEEIDPDVILLWCCIRVPLIRFALRRSRARLGIHLGNPNFPGRWSDRLLLTQQMVMPSPVRTRLFSCSEHVRRSFATGYWGQFENRVVYNPVEIPRTTADTHRLAAPVPPRLGMVARLDEIKDHATLVRAMGILRDRGLRVDLELVGDGPGRVALEQLIRNLDLSSCVRLTGYCEDIPARLATWSLFVYSTTEREGLGNSVVEALAAGIPCVVSDLPMMREIDGGKNLMRFFRAGDAANCAEKIVAAWRDEELQARVAANGPGHVRHCHSPAGYCEQVTQFLMAGDATAAHALAP